MNKKLLSVIALSVALVGCQQQAKNAADSAANKAEEVKNAAVEKVENAKNAMEDKAEEKSDAVTAATHENIKVTPEEAVAKFKEAHADAKIESVSLDNDDDKGFYYEVQGSNGAEEFEVEIDPVTGDVTRDEKEKDSDNDGFIDETLVAKAMDLAKKAIEDAGRDKYYNTAWEISVKDGVNVVEVELHGHDVPELEYSYNAQTGELIEKK
ncbi:Peptidase propeptide and YPEB domain-containing protein [Peptoniphilus asaccharolyticus DSM 20463]|uniref:Peptidase propeptide and YPEB domain-containing protein n=1 Tax=Peptoniphilus asaccharolyticus DSM 20463 TaxID=573058 RepID=A0A1W1VFT8_PEPAS|nr:PepSY domain-containing protein [Peptoniphilus asaccharolyticus]MBL7575881.1 PepSY domain-containing protein [Peptoniphilus asaccharolyticus]SMB92090.1 Peptidase propeptide and YPEB domain-containing protein [Peptoniphilus asaccharolyticus DSM 20463]